VTRTVVIRTATEMRALGRSLGEGASRGTVIALYGQLGAGKTTLTQGIAAGVGVNPRDVTSASFILCAEHTRGRLPLYHVDLYRLDTESVYLSGLEEYFGSDGLTVVEWADRGEELLPRHTLRINIRVEDGGRRVVKIASRTRFTLPDRFQPSAKGSPVHAGSRRLRPSSLCTVV